MKLGQQGSVLSAVHAAQETQNIWYDFSPTS